MSKRILVIGSGGREHALVMAIKSSPQNPKVFCAPGNPGIKSLATLIDIPVTNIDLILDACLKNKIDLVVVGPELPLSLGLVDKLRGLNIAAFGPTQKAAILESSKTFTKDFAKRHCIPTASYEIFTDIGHAEEHLKTKCNFPIVIKADGLAAGKGVVIAQNLNEATNAVRNMLRGEWFGDSGKSVVIEEFLSGEEASFIIMTDGKTIKEFPASQDHKRVFDKDQGPNTGGMGAYAPAPVVTAKVRKRILQKIIEPTLAGMEAESRPYSGFLYAGVMIDKNENPFLIEFNCRLGDPEAEVLLPLVEGDFALALLNASQNNLQGDEFSFSQNTCVGVVLASGGYPSNFEKGFKISGLEKNSDNALVFHSGTKIRDNKIVTDGGRVLVVCSSKPTLKDAVDHAYKACKNISWPGMHYRQDIAHKGFK